MKRFRFFKSEYIEFIFVSDTELDFAEHCHCSDYVVTLIKNGIAVLKCENKKRIITNGESFIAAPYENHALTSETAVSMITMCIKKSAVRFFGREDFWAVVNRSLADIAVKGYMTVSDRAAFSDACEKLYEEFHSSSDGNDYLSAAVREIEAAPEENKSVNTMAGEAFISKYHFIRCFRQRAGLTPHKLRVQSRIRKSQRLLAEGLSAADTAQAVGFYDQSHFDKYFKKVVGVSPAEYISSLSNFLQA